MQKMPQWIKNNVAMNKIWNRTRNYNQNYLAAVCGQTGSGKSWYATSLAHNMDIDHNEYSRFNVDRIVFSGSDFIALVKKNLPKGSFIIWDEVGIGINSRTFYEQENLNISYVTQTFRFKNNCVLYTVPAFHYIDKQVRQLFHSYFELNSIDYSNKTSTAKYFDILYDSREGNVMYPQPRSIDEFGVKERITKIEMPIAPKELLDAYEEKKKAFMEEAYDKYESEMKDSGNFGRSLDKDAMKEEVLDNLEKFTNEKGTVDPSLIEVEFNIGHQSSISIAKSVRKALTHI